MEDITSIRVTEDVRKWINELRQILRENLQKPSLSQNEVIRWMCIQTIGGANKIYTENYWRIHDTLREATELLDTKKLYEAVSAMRDEDLAENIRPEELSNAKPGVIFRAAKKSGIVTEGRNVEDIREELLRLTRRGA